jgi:hypothetical protein
LNSRLAEKAMIPSARDDEVPARIGSGADDLKLQRIVTGYPAFAQAKVAADGFRRFASDGKPGSRWGRISRSAAVSHGRTAGTPLWTVI